MHFKWRTFEYFMKFQLHLVRITLEPSAKVIQLTVPVSVRISISSVDGGPLHIVRQMRFSFKLS